MAGSAAVDNTMDSKTKIIFFIVFTFAADFCDSLLTTF
jgi:hypothetical protein